MFTLNVDNEIELALVQESFAPLYVELVAEHKAYLSQWLAWPDFCSSEQDFRLFVHRSLHDYADGKSLTCAIFTMEIWSAILACMKLIRAWPHLYRLLAG